MLNMFDWHFGLAQIFMVFPQRVIHFLKKVEKEDFDCWIVNNFNQ